MISLQYPSSVCLSAARPLKNSRRTPVSFLGMPAAYSEGDGIKVKVKLGVEPAQEGASMFETVSSNLSSRFSGE